MAADLRRPELAANLAALEQRLVSACRAAGKPRSDVTLVAVTKTWPASDAALLRDLGVLDLAENRDQEAAAKAAAVEGVRWHFVGQLQTNKAASVSSYASLVHTVDRSPLVVALARGAQRADRVLDVLLQVSLDGDPRRGGALLRDVAALADEVALSGHLRLAGVMAVAPQRGDPRGAFDLLCSVAYDVRRAHPGATTISAGMSGDLEAAVAAGSTLVRVGSAILGDRPPLLL